MRLPVMLTTYTIGLALATTAGAQTATSGTSGQMAHHSGKRERAGSATRSHQTARPNRKGGAQGPGQTMSTNGPSYNAGGTNPDGSLPH